MNHKLSHPLRKTLVNQLVFIDENRYNLLELYASAVPLRDRNSQFLDLYVTAVENFLQNLDDESSNKLNKVLIGSSVSVLFEEDHTLEQFTICFPETSNPEDGYISFHSPVGRQLLLRGLNENVSLATPNGETNVIIKEINFTLYE